MSLREAVDLYKLRGGGHELRTPYWINEPGVMSGPFNGKGSPQQIQEELDRIISEYKDPLNNPEEVRFLMLRNGLGIDCSGFIYHVLSTYLQAGKGVDLADHLVIYKTEVEQALEKNSWRDKVSEDEVASMPDKISLTQVCEKFEKSPASLTNVARLCDENSTDQIDRTEDVRKGDMLRLQGDYGDHIGIVIENSSSEILYASADFDPIGPGGVTFHDITIANPEEGLGKQRWRAKEAFVKACRLKVLAD